MSTALLTVSGTVIVALISGIFLLFRSHLKPKVSIYDLEIDKLWKHIGEQDQKIEALTKDRDAQRALVRVLGDGFDALSGFVERTSPTPVFSRIERDAISRAKVLRADESLWDTIPYPPDQPIS